MCMPTQCTNEACGKTTWKGCGMHIDTALKSVPMDERCGCKAKTQQEHDEKKTAATCQQ